MQRGRKSKSAIESLTSPDAIPRMIKPPAHLSEAESKLFREIISMVPASHFLPSDVPLLASYCSATILSRKALRMIERDAAFVPIWERSVRVQASLATRLRLSPQSRLDPKTLGRAARNSLAPSAYDLMRGFTDDD